MTPAFGFGKLSFHVPDLGSSVYFVQKIVRSYFCLYDKVRYCSLVCSTEIEDRLYLGPLRLFIISDNQIKNVELF